MDADEYRTALKKFSLADSLLGESTHWSIALRPKQVTLGALVMLPKRAIDDFDAVDPAEAYDLFRATARCQGVLRSAFRPDKFNLIAAMMKDNFVHFHLVPRYHSPPVFAGLDWPDVAWPALVDFSYESSGQHARAAVLERLRVEFGVSES